MLQKQAEFCSIPRVKQLPISTSPEEAASQSAPLAGARAEAERLSGQPVELRVMELARPFADARAAEAAFPELYLDPRFALYHRDGAWRIAVRFWRPCEAAPVGRSVREAARGGAGLARTRAEAEALLAGPAELVEEAVAHYASLRRAEAARVRLVHAAAARVAPQQGKQALLLRFWRPRPAPAALHERIEAPLRPRAPQLSPYVGLFEQLAPENPAVILAEEGDGRCGD